MLPSRRGESSRLSLSMTGKTLTLAHQGKPSLANLTCYSADGGVVSTQGSHSKTADIDDAEDAAWNNVVEGESLLEVPPDFDVETEPNPPGTHLDYGEPSGTPGIEPSLVTAENFQPPQNTTPELNLNEKKFFSPLSLSVLPEDVQEALSTSDFLTRFFLVCLLT